MISRSAATSLGLATALLLPAGVAASETPGPPDAGLVEKVEVRLVILDVLVVDRKGNPVPGLAEEEFELTVDGRPVPLSSFDVSCSDHPAGSIVLAFDYQHLAEGQRAHALDLARDAIAQGPAEGRETMVVAMIGGLRVELPFTADRDRITSALGHMESDATLYAGNFAHMNEHGFVRGLTALFDVLGTIPGPKAVILFSAMQDVPLEDQFGQLAALAAASRSSIYPVDVRGLQSERPADREVAQAPPKENIQHLPNTIGNVAKSAMEFGDDKGGDFDVREAPIIKPTGEKPG